MLSRRGFLGTLGASVGSLILWPSKAAEAKALSTPTIRAAINRTPPTFQKACHAVMRGLCQSLRHPSILISKGIIGETEGQSALTRQWSVSAEDCLTLDDYHLVGVKLAEQVNRERWSVFGTLPLPMTETVYRVSSVKDGVSVRGVRSYNALEDRYMVRFDMVGG